MHLSSGIVFRAGAFLVASAVIAASSFALADSRRAAGVPDRIEADRLAVDLIRARAGALHDLALVRADAVVAVAEGAGVPDGTLERVIDAGAELRATTDPVAEAAGPIAREANAIAAAYDQFDPGDVSAMSVSEQFESIGDLGHLYCCAGQDTGVRSGLAEARRLDTLVYAHGGWTFFSDAYLGGVYVATSVPIDTVSDYFLYDVGIAEDAAGFIAEDPLLDYFPPDLEASTPRTWAALAPLLSSPIAEDVRDALRWATEGDAAAGVAPPQTVREFVRSLTDFAEAQYEIVLAEVDTVDAALDARRADSERRSGELFRWALAGYAVALALIVWQLVSIRRARIAAEVERASAVMRLDMIGVVAHELRSPLTGIAGFARFLSTDWRTLDDDQVDEFLQNIESQSEEMLYLVEDLLTMRRLDSGTVRLEKSQVDVADVATRVASAVFRETDRTLEIDTAPGLRVSCDPHRLQQILRNLLDNARKYGGPTIRIATSTVEGRCRISVIDDGNGVPASETERIFDAFDQGDTEGRNTQGFGLGLSIVRDLATAMGGDAGYSPAEPRGAEFWVDVPVADSASVPAATGA